jgi:hypothetical protein
LQGVAAKPVTPSCRAASLTPLFRYVEDETGAFDWVNPDEVHAFITELLRPMGTHLYGRRLYETMAYWDAPLESYPPEHRDFAHCGRRPRRSSFHER